MKSNISLTISICIAGCFLVLAADGSTLAAGVAVELPAIQTVCEDQVWLVNTRGISGSAYAPRMRIHKLENNCWRQASVDDLLANDDPRRITAFYVHGNRIESHEAAPTALKMYRTVACRRERPPLRFIIWSWPSDQIAGIRRDVNVKAQRASLEAYYLAWLVAQMNQPQRISLLGYSFGAKSICGAMHLLAGGRADGYSLGDRASQDTARRVRVVLMAPAMHNNWLAPGSKYQLAMHRVDRAVVFYNSCDSVLKWYRLFEPSHPEALGYTGVAGVGRADAWRIRQLDACSTVGRDHNVEVYMQSPSLMGTLRKYALWDEI